MAFWDDVGTWIGDLTGFNQSQRSKSSADMAKENQASAAGTLKGAAGVGGTQFAEEAGKAGQALGNQMGEQAATMGTQKATQAARTAGLNKGQAALAGSQQAGQLYGAGQQAGQGLGMGAYGQGAGNQVNAASNLGNLGTGQQTGAQNSQNAGTAAGGSLLGAIGGLFSDKEMKTDIRPAPNVTEILAKLDPVRFKYKPEAGEGLGEHVGVMAQDIEKTPMKENVIDTPEGKMVDTRKQEMSNLDLIVQLGAEVARLREGKK